MGLARSTYYDMPPAQPIDEARLVEQIKTICAEWPAHGYRRVTFELHEQGYLINHKKVMRLMKENGLSVRARRRLVVTTDSNHDQPIAPNRLAELPAPKGPDQIWVADITYVSTAQGWAYVTAVLDLYSRRIVGWAVGQQINTMLVMMGLSMALVHRQPPQGLIFHSDRGVQYASGEFRHALENARLVASMSRRGNCYDNAAMEAFWSTLKLELIYRRQFENAAQVRQAIFDYIEVFYNRQRLHSALGYQTPADFEAANN